MSTSSSRDGVRLVSEILQSPRLAHAATVAAIGLSICSSGIRSLIGWAGLISMLATLVVLAAASLIARRRALDWQGLLPVSLLIFVGWAASSIIWSQYQWSSLGGIAYLIAFTALGVSIALTRDTIQIVRSFGDVFRVVLVVSLALEILSGVLIDAPLRFLGVQGNLDSLGPLQGIMGSRNQMGLIALLALITFATEYRTKSLNRSLSIASMLLAGTFILLSRSPVTSGVLAVLAAAVLALWLLRRVAPERRTFWQLAILVVAVVLAIVAWIFRANIIMLFSANSELTYRLNLWRRLSELTSLHPLEGWGWIGHWRPELQPFPAFAIAGQREPHSALNAYLDVWFQLGLVGLFAFSVLVLLTFTRSWLLAGRRRSIVFAWPALVLVALIVTSLAESSILVEYGWLTFVVCCVKAAHQLSWRSALSKPADSDQ